MVIGVGKTALALHRVHRVADRFPDGQLYLNLRGDAAMTPAEALPGFLDALGVPPERIPATVDGQPADTCQLIGDRYYQASTLTSLGDTHHAAGHPEGARHAWRQAAHILDELGHPGADDVRARLGRPVHPDVSAAAASNPR